MYQLSCRQLTWIETRLYCLLYVERGLCMYMRRSEMGEYVKKCDEVAERSGGDSTEDIRLGRNSGRKRKFYSEVDDDNGGGSDETKNSISPAAEMMCGCSVLKVEESVDEESLRALNLEENSVAVESRSGGGEIGADNSMSILIHGFFSRETSPTSELCVDSEDTALHSPRKVGIMPSASELEEFFAEAEKNEHKRFSEKYNYDVVMDIPLKGRYQWVRLNP